MATINRHLLWVLAAVVLISVCITPVRAKHDGLYPEYDAFTLVIEEVMSKYVEKVDREKLFEGAYKGMLATLDPYSQYISPEQLAEFNVSTKGEFGGLGIEIGVRDGILTVITPLRGTPAYDAGILPGDKIIKIEEEVTENMSIAEAVKKLRGKPGTKVTITIVHEGSRVPEEVTIERAIIEVPSVEYEMVDEEAKIGYIHLITFQEHTAAKLAETIHELQKKGMKALVLDLRNNPGGLLSSAVDVADAFLKGGEIVRTVGREASQSVPYSATPKTLGDFPMAVLINKGSASASEIVAGALKDHNRAILVGTNTFGKGSVQSVIPISVGDEKEERGALKLTTARYYTPKSKESIEKTGIKPNIEVDIPWDLQLKLRRQQHEEHIKRQSGHEVNKTSREIVALTVEEKMQRLLLDYRRDKIQAGELVPKLIEIVEEGKEEGKEDEKVEDPQLRRAIDSLKVVEVFQGAASK